MAQKVLFQTALADLETSDVEGKSVLRHVEDGKIYRWVKNVSATALVAAGACLKNLTSVLVNMNVGVRSVDTLTAATAQLSIPAGVPVTAIAASGASTGDHGWIQVAGPARVSMTVSDTTAAASGWPGRLSICTNLPATCFWDVPENGAEDATTIAAASVVFVKGVRLMAKFATGTKSDARSAAVEVLCL